MTTYYLRMEGVNLSTVFDDTNQISVIRGASLLLREATHLIEKSFSQLKKISSGASIGLFEFEAQDDADDIRQQVVERLNLHFRLQYFTFVVDIQAKTEQFEIDKEALIARNRFRQMQQLSFAVPKQKASLTVCELTNLLPVSNPKPITLGEKQSLLSDSIQVRLRYGQHQRREFYRQETQLKIRPVESLNSLAEYSKYSNVPTNLSHKIAVLYLDGNDFRKIQQKYCTQSSVLKQFDEEIQGKRRTFLTNFLNKIQADPVFLNKGELRLETLLWGGDEMLFVVPACKGLELLRYFYEISQDWRFKKAKLTHAGGLVFCRAKTPIRRIRYFAQELADGVKNRPQGREKNLFDYMVLESIDYPSESVDKLRQKIFPAELTKSYYPLTPFNVEKLQALHYLKENVPKSQAYTLVRAITQGIAAYEEKRDRLTTVINNEKLDQQINEKLAIAFPAQDICWQWIHLVELWDYIPEEFEDAAICL